jgi:hypothetical protein
MASPVRIPAETAVEIVTSRRRASPSMRDMRATRDPRSGSTL